MKSTDLERTREAYNEASREVRAAREELAAAERMILYCGVMSPHLARRNRALKRLEDAKTGLSCANDAFDAAMRADKKRKRQAFVARQYQQNS